MSSSTPENPSYFSTGEGGYAVIVSNEPANVYVLRSARWPHRHVKWMTATWHGRLRLRVRRLLHRA